MIELSLYFFFVRFEVFMAVTMKNAVFWDVMPCGSSKNRRFGGTCHLHHQGDIVFLRIMLQLLIIANVPSSPILVTLIMEAIRPSKTLTLTRATQHNNIEDGILPSLYCL
jgi:hypothetical protein